jgi:hypothetical protein
METKFIIVAGNLSDGFKFYGPYASFDDADEASRLFGMQSTWISPLETADFAKMED